MKRNRKKNFIILLVALTVLIVPFSFYLVDTQLCSCNKLYSTNIPVIDDESLGASLAFYLSKDFSIIESDKTYRCRNSLYKVNFANMENKNQVLYLDSKGNVYNCP